MFILLSLMTVFAHARLPSCEEDFATDRTTLYLMTKDGRTSHVLSLGRDERVLNAAARTALDAADLIVFEAGTRVPPAATSPGLSARLSGGAWIRLIERLIAKGVPLAAIDGLSPALAYHLLEATPSQLAAADVTHQIRRAAQARGAVVEALEGAEEQDRLGEAAFGATELEEVLTSAGPAPSLADLRDRKPELYARLTTERHRAWVEKIAGIHRRRGRTVFVLNGLHMGGPDGVLNRLADAGYDLRQVN